MNTEEVCKMIDAITEGEEFTLSVPVPVGEDSLTLKFHEDEISIYGAHGFATAIRNLRDIREIAAALVAWANRKDGTIDLAAMSILGSIRWAELKNATVAQIADSPAPEDCNFPKVWHTSATHRRLHYTNGKCQPVERDVQNDLLSEKRERDVAIWREEWYRRNVRHMTPETLKRNMRDLKEIKAQTPVSPEYDDIQKAIDIVHDSLMGIKPFPAEGDNV